MKICPRCDKILLETSTKKYCSIACRSKFKYIRDSEKLKQKRLINKDKINEYQVKWRLANKDKIQLQNAQYREENKTTCLALQAEWRATHREQIRQYHINYFQKVRKHDLNFKLRNNLRIRLYKALKNDQKVGSAVSDLGCTIEELKKYLESQFKPGMTWENWSRYGWHIDHVVPLVHFDLTDPKQFKKACNYTNLQPLWAQDNLSKGDKLC